MLRCYHTSSWQSDAYDAMAHVATTLQAVRAVAIVDGRPRAASRNCISAWPEMKNSDQKTQIDVLNTF